MTIFLPHVFSALYLKLIMRFQIVTVGPKSSQEVLRTALAMGADRAIHVYSDLRLDQELQPMAVARAFEKLAKKEGGYFDKTDLLASLLSE